MAEQQSFFTRIGRWFRGESTTQTLIDDNPSDGAIEPVQAARSTFLRPWSKRDQAISQLQEGFQTLTDLMGTIRDHLEKQSVRQDELLGYLSHLPEALRQIPEAQRSHSEALHAIHQHMVQHSTQQKQLSDVLDRICEASANHQKALDVLNNRVEDIDRHDQAIVDNLRNVGAAMESVSRNSTTSTQVLEHLRENLNSRDGQIERILMKQNARFTWMLAVAIFLSVAALVTVIVMGYLMYYRTP